VNWWKETINWRWAGPSAAAAQLKNVTAPSASPARLGWTWGPSAAALAVSKPQGQDADIICRELENKAKENGRLGTDDRFSLQQTDYASSISREQSQNCVPNASRPG